MNNCLETKSVNLGTEDQGILKVAAERWQRAQNWESQHWNRSNRPFRNVAKRVLQKIGFRKHEIGDDWNHWWAERFNHYDFIPRDVENAIEFGCGPYTNLRIVSAGRKIAHAYCSDPLLRTYLKFRYTWLSESYRRHEVLIDDHPMEHAPFASDFFDLVVVINVLDHVRDAPECLRQAVRVVKPQGVLVLGQDLTCEEDLHMPGVLNDVGHPIRINHRTLDSCLDGVFDPIIRRILSREEGREPKAHYGTYLYAGIKRIH